MRIPGWTQRSNYFIKTDSNLQPPILSTPFLNGWIFRGLGKNVPLDLNAQI